MNSPCAEYRDLMWKYLSGELSVLAFQMSYIDKFKGEKRALDEEMFLLLDELFGDADAYTEDEGLLMEDSKFYLDEQRFKEKVKYVFDKLRLKTG